ncbi:hypothetical protein BJ742DRAFT_839169 [Cladochytrium replicatum]|nr:hypothetical protein BJ742DRAFT_839169 [Cladochytrium replicatum]
MSMSPTTQAAASEAEIAKQEDDRKTALLNKIFKDARKDAVKDEKVWLSEIPPSEKEDEPTSGASRDPAENQAVPSGAQTQGAVNPQPAGNGEPSLPSKFPPEDDSEVIDEIERNTLSLLYANTKAMVNAYQPKFDCEKKEAIYKEIAYTQDYHDDDQMGVVRFRGIALPRTVRHVKVVVVEMNGFYKYDQLTDEKNVPWWVNFTDRTLFAWFHKKGLGLASEEIRAFEHPSMCSLREMLSDIGNHKLTKDENLSKKKWYKVISEEVTGDDLPITSWLDFLYKPDSIVRKPKRFYQIFERPRERRLNCVPDLEKDRAAYDNFIPRTTDPANRPTPILVIGAKRFGEVNTKIKRKGETKQTNIYGENFRQATVVEARSTATAFWTVPKTQAQPSKVTVNNFISIEALDKMTNPELYRGNYTIHQIRTLLRTALTGFAAARAVSLGSEPPVYHTNPAALPNTDTSSGPLITMQDATQTQSIAVTTPPNSPQGHPVASSQRSHSSNDSTLVRLSDVPTDSARTMNTVATSSDVRSVFTNNPTTVDDTPNVRARRGGAAGSVGSGESAVDLGSASNGNEVVGNTSNVNAGNGSAVNGNAANTSAAANDRNRELRDVNVQINTGNWGCGEYKNHKSVIAFIQCTAAAMVGGTFETVTERFAVFKPMISRLNYHYDQSNKTEKEEVEDGIALFKEMWGGYGVDSQQTGSTTKAWEEEKEYQSPLGRESGVTVRYVNVEKFLEAATKRFEKEEWKWMEGDAGRAKA